MRFKDYEIEKAISLVPNAVVYDNLWEPVIILSQYKEGIIYANKAFKEAFNKSSDQEIMVFISKLFDFNKENKGEENLIKKSPFKDFNAIDILLSDNTNAKLFILNIATQCTIDTEHFHYQLLLAAEKELGFGCWNINLEKDQFFWSDGMAQIFGYSNSEEVKGKKNFKGFLNHIHSNNKEEILSKLQNRDDESTGSEIEGTEVNILKTDGTAKRVILKTHYLEKDKNGRVLNLYGTIRDVTQLREREKIIKQQVNELNKSNDALTQFAYTASHDLQEPLRKIEAFGDRLKNSLGDDLAEKPQRYLDKILSSTQRMSVLIENILTLSRLNSAKTENEVVNLNTILEGIVNDYETSLEETGAIINYDLPNLKGIKTQFHQLFQNLVGNGIKFRYPGRQPIININYTRRKGSTIKEFGADGDKEYFEIKIEDNGIGFDQKFENSIYTPFKRLVGKTEFAGTGIGLAICKKVMDNHGGYLRAESIEDKGTTFYLYFQIS